MGTKADRAFNTNESVEMNVNAERLLRRIVSDDAADGLGLKKTAMATYDFEEHGGAISAIGLGVTIPDNAVIIRAWYDVLTTCITAGADAGSLAISVEGADDIVAATTVVAGGNVWDAGLHEAIPTGTIANSVKTTGAKEVIATIAVQAFTAGKLRVFFEYVVTG